MIMKTILPAALVVAFGFTGATLAHESGATSGQGTATQAAPCDGANGQPVACEGYQGNAAPGQQGPAGAGSMPGPGMMQGNNSTPGQGTGPAQQRGLGMN